MSQPEPATESGFNPARNQPKNDYEARYGQLGGREIRGGFAVESEIPLSEIEVRDSGTGRKQFTIAGHAAVFNQFSLDLGGFRERILPGFFDDVLSRDPDVWHLWDHDTRWILSRTKSKTLTLELTERGLKMWSKPAPTSYAADLRVLMERGDIDQASFAFNVAEDDWRIVEENGVEVIERDLIRCGELFDVTTTAMGAYPQTDSQLARSMALSYAIQTGHLAGGATEEASSLDTEGDVESRATPDDPVDEVSSAEPSLADWRASTRRAVEEERTRHLQAMKELFK